MRRLYKWSKCIAGLLLVMVLCVGLIPTKVVAATGSITLQYMFSDCSFSLYHVANYTNTGSFELTDDFSGLSVDWSSLTEDDNWYALAQTLDSVVVSDAINSTVTSATDTNGTVSFTGLATGLYLMTAEIKADANGTYYTVTPLLIAVPGTNSAGDVEYNRTITITKYSTKTTSSVHVQKIWEGDSSNQPTSITVGLYADGQLIDTQELSSSNNWRYTWTDLDTDVKWTVAETQVTTGYTVAYSTADDGTFVITNKANETGDSESEPDTTDIREPYTDTPSNIDGTDSINEVDDTDNSEGVDPDDSEDLGDTGDVGDEDSSSKDTSSGNKSSDDSEDLPQTGLDWGPAAVLVLIGLGCLLIGVVKNRMERRSE